jgi:hypothetical protein
MKTAFRRLKVLVAAAHAFALSACMLVGGDALVTPGGAEDFPNTVTELGKIALVEFSSSGDWEQVQNIELPEMPTLDGLDSLQIAPPQAKVAALGKSGGLGKTSIDTLDLSLWEVDYNKLFEAIVLGRLYAYAYDSTATAVRRDTVIVQYLGARTSISAVQDSIESNPGKFLLPLDYRGVVRTAATGVRRWYRLRNTDGVGEMDLAEYATYTPLPNGGEHRRYAKIYSPEGGFEEADQVPESYELLRRGPGGDTLEWTLVRDADWDRKLWGAGSSGIVDIFTRVRNPESQPALARMHVSMRADFRHSTVNGDSLRQLNYQEQRWLRSGGNVIFTLNGTGTGSLLAANDTAIMVVDTTYSLQDSAIKYTARYKLLLGARTDRMQDHKLVGYGISKYARLGPVFHTLSVFAPTVPVPMGQSGFEGLLSFTVAYRNEDTVKTEGSIGPNGMDLTVRSLKEGVASSFQVLLDAAGNLLQFTPIPQDATATAKLAKRAPAKP